MRNRFDMDAIHFHAVVRATTTRLYAIYTSGIRRITDAFCNGMYNICNY